MRVLPGSHGIDPAGLVPGCDLVLDPEPRHGATLPQGTIADDHLTTAQRRAVERESLAATKAWRKAHDQALTIDSVCLPFVWELEIYMLVRELVLDAARLQASIEAHRPPRIELAQPGHRTAPLIRLVAAAGGVALSDTPAAPPPGSEVREPTHSPRLPHRARRAIGTGARRAGFPSHLKTGSILFVSYWPLDPVIDAMLERGGLRPAVVAEKLPRGPRRSLRAARSGGWVGTPGPRERKRARGLLKTALVSLGEATEIEAFGIPIGALVHDRAVDLARTRGADDLARLAQIRRSFARGRPGALLTAWDTVPLARLLITAARERDVPTLALPHGMYLPPTLLHEPEAIGDMQLTEELLLWSDRNPHPARPDARSVTVVGYPVPHAPPPPTRRLTPGAATPVVLILTQVATKNPPFSPRIEIEHFLAAIDAVTSAAPDARIVLRPHPSADSGAAGQAAAHNSVASISIDAETPIMTLLAEADICVGALTAASLQCALVGTPMVALNLSGFEWSWPLDARSSVPVAGSSAELSEWIARWRGGEELPGREELLGALGAGGNHATNRILGALDRKLARLDPVAMSAPAPSP